LSTSSLTRGINVTNDSLTNVSSVSLDKSGSISTGFKNFGSVDSGSYVYIPGTDIFSFVQNDGSVFLGNVPAGIISELILTTAKRKKTNVLRNEVLIVPEGTVSIENPLWKYSRKIILNTSSSGAAVAGDVYGFPVLIRLNTVNFDFSQARPDGSDLMFTAYNKKSLPLEIERWDVSIGQAEIWVKIDTVFGNNSEQSIMMYWGNAAASRLSQSDRVFDTANGFQGVWHLNDGSDTICDATGNQIHGIRNGKLSQSACMIGYGQAFDSTGAYCDMGNVLNPGSGNFTVSAWIKRANTGLQTIFAKSNGGNPSATYGWSLSFGVSDQLHGFTASGGSSWADPGTFDFWTNADATVKDSTVWHYVVAVVDRSSSAGSRLYLDGIDVSGGSNGDISVLGSLINTSSLRIGAESDGGYPWTGSIDECVFSRNVRSESWIRLCFINQGPEDRLVIFK
jgi:biopolymer transport protein ExbB